MVESTDRLIVISNCQSLPLARTLALGIHGIKVDFFDVSMLNHESHTERLNDLLSGEYHAVFTVPLSEKLKPIETASLRSIYGERLHVFTNMYFGGLHPDITYIGVMNQRVGGFLTDYHSKIVLFGYAEKMSETDVYSLFRPSIYEKLGYYDAYQASIADLEERDRSCDIQFSKKFLEIIRSRVSLYTVNHVADVVFRTLCGVMCERIGVPYVSYPDEYLTNALSDNVIWPIHDELAEAAQLGYRTPQHFIRSRSDDGRSFDLSQMIGAFFEKYRSIESSRLKQELANMAFYPMFRKALL